MKTKPNIDELNDAFGIDGHIEFAVGKGSFPLAVVENEFAAADVYLHGGHVTAFQPRGATPVLWLSETAEFGEGKAIRGGTPVCWPWFGPHPTGEDLPQHGFARVSEWGVTATNALPDGRTELCLRMEDDDETRALWPHPFALDLRVIVGAELHTELTTRNTGPETIEVGGALHTYFRVGDIDRVSIGGLGGRDYIDRLDGDRAKRQAGSIEIAGEVDRVYMESADACAIDDPVLKRRIRIAKAGSRTTVVWNPWVDKSRRMKDFPDDGFRSMVCVESTNAVSDVYPVSPGERHTLSQTVAVEDIA